MHELSICRSIVDIVDRHASGREVAVVRVQVGQLRQIVPDTLVYCWSLINEGSRHAATRLEVESVPAAIECLDCSARTPLDEPILVCSGCGGTRIAIVSGEEFLITSLELAGLDREGSEIDGPVPQA